jgi:hypothetical protein
MSIGRDLLLEIIDAAERDPALVERVRRALGAHPAEAKPVAVYLRAVEYARRVSLSERTVWGLISQGLPTIGGGRSRRIDVARADEWLRGQQAPGGCGDRGAGPASGAACGGEGIAMRRDPFIFRRWKSLEKYSRILNIWSPILKPAPTVAFHEPWDPG